MKRSIQQLRAELDALEAGRGSVAAARARLEAAEERAQASEREALEWDVMRSLRNTMATYRSTPATPAKRQVRAMMLQTIRQDIAILEGQPAPRRPLERGYMGGHARVTKVRR